MLCFESEGGLGVQWLYFTTEVMNDYRWLMFHDTCLIRWPSLFNEMDGQIDDTYNLQQQ